MTNPANTPATITARLCADARSGVLEQWCLELGIDVLVLHGSAVSDPTTAGDVDLAYSPDFRRDAAHRPSILDVATAFLERYGEGIDMMDLSRAGLVARHEALNHCLLLVDATGEKFALLDMMTDREYLNTQYRRDFELRSLLS